MLLRLIRAFLNDSYCLRILSNSVSEIIEKSLSEKYYFIKNEEYEKTLKKYKELEQSVEKYTELIEAQADELTEINTQKALTQKELNEIENNLTLQTLRLQKTEDLVEMEKLKFIEFETKLQKKVEMSREIKQIIHLEIEEANRQIESNFRDTQESFKKHLEHYIAKLDDLNP